MPAQVKATPHVSLSFEEHGLRGTSSHASLYECKMASQTCMKFKDFHLLHSTANTVCTPKSSIPGPYTVFYHTRRGRYHRATGTNENAVYLIRHSWTLILSPFNKERLRNTVVSVQFGCLVKNVGSGRNDILKTYQVRLW